MRVVKDVEPIVSGALGPAEHSCQSLEAHRVPVLRGKPGAQIAEDVAGRKRIARSGHKTVIKKFCFPRLFVHAFWFASKLMVAAFVPDEHALPTTSLTRDRKSTRLNSSHLGIS